MPGRKDTLALFVLSGIWGSSYLLIAIGGQSLPPITLVTIRLAIGAVALQSILRLRRAPLPRSRRILAALAFMGLTNNIIPFTLITWAETPGAHQVSSGLAAILVATVPIFTVVLAHFVLRDERFTVWAVAGILLGFAGVLVLMSPRLEGPSGDRATLGALAVIAASLSYAVAAIFSRRVLSGVTPIVIGAMQMTWSVVFLVPTALLFEHADLSQVSPQAWFDVAWLGGLRSGVAYILYFGLIQSVGATRTTLVTYLSPFVAVILGTVFNAEPIYWTLMAGIVLITGGAAMVNRKPRPASFDYAALRSGCPPTR